MYTHTHTHTHTRARVHVEHTQQARWSVIWCDAWPTHIQSMSQAQQARLHCSSLH